MPTPSREVQDALLEQRVSALERQVQRLTEERDKAMRWAVLTLGAALIGLLTWLFTFVTTHITGR